MVQRRHRPRILAIGPSTEIAETRGDSLDERQAHAFDDELSQLSLRRPFARQQQAVCPDVPLDPPPHVPPRQRHGPPPIPPHARIFLPLALDAAPFSAPPPPPHPPPSYPPALPPPASPPHLSAPSP